MARYAPHPPWRLPNAVAGSSDGQTPQLADPYAPRLLDVLRTQDSGAWLHGSGYALCFTSALAPPFSYLMRVGRRGRRFGLPSPLCLALEAWSGALFVCMAAWAFVARGATSAMQPCRRAPSSPALRRCAYVAAPPGSACHASTPGFTTPPVLSPPPLLQKRCP